MKLFKFCLIDPPWQFATFSDKGMNRSAENHYPCLDIKAQTGHSPVNPSRHGRGFGDVHVGHSLFSEARY